MPKRILIIAPAWIGDAVMAQPLLQQLSLHQPKCEISVFANDWVAPLFQRMPEVTRILANPFKHGNIQLLNRWRLARTLKKYSFDQAIVLPNTWKSALLPWFAGIPQRTGFIGEGRYALLNDIYPLDSGKLPRLAQRFSFLAQPHQDIPPSWYPKLSVQRSLCLQTQRHYGIGTEQPIAILCPGAEYGTAKQWPPTYFAQLASYLHSLNYQVALLGAINDVPLADTIQRNAACHVHNFVGKTTLADAIDLLALANLVITNDSGLMHIAAALQRPLIAIYGSSSPAFTPPLVDEAEIVYLDIECSPCFERVCPLGHFDCMKKMKPHHVIMAVQRITKRLSESNRQTDQLSIG